MTHPISTEERSLRCELSNAVEHITRTLNRCPALGDLSRAERSTVIEVIDTTGSAVAEALGYVAALEQLGSATEEALAIAGSSRIALSVVSDVLALLAAEIDSAAVA